MKEERDTCYMRTKTNSFHPYTIEVADGRVIFSRDASSKRANISYELAAIQCVRAFLSEKDATSKGFRMLLIQSRSKAREILFDTREVCQKWFTMILEAQGFNENRLSAYKIVQSLGEGAFGKVLLAKHRHSGLKVAVKMIDKTRIEKTFANLSQSYEELEVLEKL